MQYFTPIRALHFCRPDASVYLCFNCLSPFGYQCGQVKNIVIKTQSSKGLYVTDKCLQTMICAYAITKKLLCCRLSSAHVRFDLSLRATRWQLCIYLINYQTKQAYRWETMKQELHQLTKYLDLPQMNYLSYPPVTNHNILGPAMSNNRGVHAHSCIMGNLGKMARN